MSLINSFKSNCRENTFYMKGFLQGLIISDTEATGNLKIAYYYFETDCCLSTAINDNYNENTSSVITFFSHSVIFLGLHPTPP